MTLKVWQIADPIIGQFGNIRISEWRPILNVQTQLSKILRRHSNNSDVANPNRLHPCFTFLSLHISEFAAHVAKYRSKHLCIRRRVFATVSIYSLFFSHFVEPANLESKRPFSRVEACHVMRLRIRERQPYRIPDAARAFLT